MIGAVSLSKCRCELSACSISSVNFTYWLRLERRTAFKSYMLPVSERVANGEIPIGLTFVKFAYSAAQAGAPLDYAKIDRMLGDSHFLVLGTKAPHPNAGKAFIDFYLDDESMRILAQNGEFANRKGIYPPLPGAEKIQYVQMEVLEPKAFEDKKKELGKIFLR